MTGSSAFDAPWKTIDTVRQRRSRMPRSLRRWMCIDPARGVEVDLALRALERRAAAGRAAPARVVVLPQPDSPARPERLAAAQLERDVVDDPHDLAPVVVAGRRPSGRARRAAGPRSGSARTSGRRSAACCSPAALQLRVDDLLDRVAHERERQHDERDARCRAAGSTTTARWPPRPPSSRRRGSGPTRSASGRPGRGTRASDSVRIESAMNSTVLAKTSGSTLGRICAPHDPAVRGAQRPRALDERALLHAQHLAAHDARRAGPAEASRWPGSSR